MDRENEVSNKVKRDTVIKIDLSEELSDEELEKFEENAGDKSMTEHFLDITIRNKASVPA